MLSPYTIWGLGCTIAVRSWGNTPRVLLENLPTCGARWAVWAWGCSPVAGLWPCSTIGHVAGPCLLAEPGEMLTRCTELRSLGFAPGE